MLNFKKTFLAFFLLVNSHTYSMNKLLKYWQNLTGENRSVYQPVTTSEQYLKATADKYEEQGLKNIFQPIQNTVDSSKIIQQNALQFHTFKQQQASEQQIRINEAREKQRLYNLEIEKAIQEETDPLRLLENLLSKPFRNYNPLHDHTKEFQEYEDAQNFIKRVAAAQCIGKKRKGAQQRQKNKGPVLKLLPLIQEETDTDFLD